MGVKGDFMIAKVIVDEIKIIQNNKVDFFQDEQFSSDWYMEFSEFGAIPVRIKTDKITNVFYSSEIRDKILKSLNLKPTHLKKRVKISVGDPIDSDGRTLFPLITGVILSQIKHT
jgi:hypothetical protein